MSASVITGTEPLRHRILDTLPHWILGLMLPLDRLYRTAFVALNYLVHRSSATKSLVDLVETSAVSEVHIEGTNICNAACTFCAYKVMERPAGLMDLRDFERYVEQICKAGVGAFDLTAVVGDPFTDKLLFDRLAVLSEKEVHTINLTTNAIALSPSKVDELLDFSESFSGEIVVRISFGGFDRHTYLEVFGVDRFDRVIGNIEYLLERKQAHSAAGPQVELHVRFPLSKLKGETYERFLDYESRGLLAIRRRVNRDLRYGTWGGKVDPAALASIGLRAAPTPKRFFGPCDLMFAKGVIVTLDGLVNACACRDVELSLPIGDLNVSSFPDILRGRKRLSLMVDMMEGRIPEVCRKCSEYRSIFSPDAEFYRRIVKKTFGPVPGELRGAAHE